MANFFIGSQDRKKHRKISETATLPTIPDEHHQEHPEPNKDAETESELEDDTVSSFKTKTLKNNLTEFFFCRNLRKNLFSLSGILKQKRSHIIGIKFEFKEFICLFLF